MQDGQGSERFWCESKKASVNIDMAQADKTPQGDFIGATRKGNNMVYTMWASSAGAGKRLRITWKVAKKRTATPPQIHLVR